MRVEELTKNHEQQLIELLMSDRDNPQVEYYLERKNGFWKPYDWFSKGQNSGWVAFEDDRLIAATALVKLPFYFDETRMPVYLNTDYFVHFEHRKSLAAYRLLSMLQKNPPHRGEAMEIGVENQPGFLTPLGTMSQKHGHTTAWIRETVLQQFFVSFQQNLNARVNRVFTSDSKTIHDYFRNYLTNDNSHSMLDFDESVLLSNLSNIQFFEIKSGDEFVKGILFDKSDLQKVIWNGQPRLYIEKYRRMLSQEKNEDFNAGDELRFLHLNFLQFNITSAAFMNEVQATLNNFCYEGKYFCWTARDLSPSFLIKSKLDKVQFTCRVPITSKNKSSLEKVKEILDQKRIVLESMFL